MTGYCTSPQNTAINNHTQTMTGWWKVPEYIRARKIFIQKKPTCERCGRKATTPLHRREDYISFEQYIKVVVELSAESGCSACNKAERAGKVPCPVCVEKYKADPENTRIHYIPFGQDRCRFCEPDYNPEMVKVRKEQRNRKKREIGRKRYREYHPEKVIRNGQWTWEHVGAK